jgi:hypothetical protein
MKNKLDIKASIKTLLTDLKIANRIVKFIRCDNPGENMTMKNDPEIKSFGVKFEFSGPRTPQRNGKVERKFQTLHGRIREMLNGADLESKLRDKIWAECVMNVTYLSNIISTKSSFKSPFELLYGDKPKLHDNLKMFGEVGVETTKERIQAKLKNRGTTCMLVGYTEHHSRDVYRMLNLTTNSIINSQDVIWLSKTYRERKENKPTISKVEEDTIELLTGFDKVKSTENATKEIEDEGNDLDKKVFRAMKKLESWFNPEATKVVEDYSHGREMTLDQVNLALFSTVMIKEPTTYEEAINFEQKEDHIKWENAINKELKELEKIGGKSLMKKISQLIAGILRINGYSK